jgi:hypothetical protein
METSGKQPDDKMKGLIDKAKELADKAEGFLKRLQRRLRTVKP